MVPQHDSGHFDASDTVLFGGTVKGPLGHYFIITWADGCHKLLWGLLFFTIR